MLVLRQHCSNMQNKTTRNLKRVRTKIFTDSKSSNKNIHIIYRKHHITVVSHKECRKANTRKQLCDESCRRSLQFTHTHTHTSASTSHNLNIVDKSDSNTNKAKYGYKMCMHAVSKLPVNMLRLIKFVM